MKPTAGSVKRLLWRLLPLARAGGPTIPDPGVVRLERRDSGARVFATLGTVRVRLERIKSVKREAP